MIIVRIIMKVLPEKQKEVMQTLLSMVDSAGKNKGCLRYDVLCNIESKTDFNVIEEWGTLEDLDRYIRSERFSVLLGTKSLLAKPLEVKIHTVSHTEGTEVINSIRSKEAPKKNF